MGRLLPHSQAVAAAVNMHRTADSGEVFESRASFCAYQPSVVIIRRNDRAGTPYFVAVEKLDYYQNRVHTAKGGGSPRGGKQNVNVIRFQAGLMLDVEFGTGRRRSTDLCEVLYPGVEFSGRGNKKLRAMVLLLNTRTNAAVSVAISSCTSLATDRKGKPVPPAIPVSELSTSSAIRDATLRWQADTRKLVGIDVATSHPSIDDETAAAAMGTENKYGTESKRAKQELEVRAPLPPTSTRTALPRML